MKAKVLVVDDEKDISELINFYLNKEGFEVLEASNGEEALEIFENEYIDLGIIDVMMPVMDGLEASLAIRLSKRTDAKNIPIIAMTAQASKECMQQCSDAGMNGHLTKPVASQKLIETIIEFT